MSGTRTNTDAMDAHGKQVSGEIAAALQQAHTASTEVKLGSDVMGELCQVWAEIFDDEVAAAGEMLKQLPKAMEASGERVLDASREFRETDERNQQDIGGVST